MNHVALLLALLLRTFPVRADVQWLELRSPHYTVLYQAGYENDVEFTRKWLDATEQLMQSKYGVSPDRYRTQVYLLPAPADVIDTGRSGEIRCCTSVADGVRTGTIRVLTRSAPIWKSANLTSSLALPKTGDDYHAKVLLAEYIPIGHYAVQDSRAPGGWLYYSAPEWFVQGIQEYDAIFHSTDSNRTATSGRLLAWAKSNSTRFSCCAPGLAIADPYNGGATFMAFLAAEFGEGIHARLLRSASKTFEEALANEIQPYSLHQLFERFRKWLETSQP